ncbi:MAG TPA: diaminopimelate epimerase [Candidatus Baltobacteraceae bacterium]|nr:diaminopimelate epimerase [Candidatus Baltobacteraceae bacterium]
MSGRVAVAKMHGARNDFVVIDARTQPIADASKLALVLCDRHTGIGADGLLIVESARNGDVAMRVMNADGSEAEMCGNGVRCVARFLDERGEGGELNVETLAGIVKTSVVERGETYRVRVDMGTPHVRNDAVSIGDAIVVDTGNPHLVLFRRSLGDVELLLLGERLQKHPYFLHGVNVHVAVVRDHSHIDMRHYERGVGLTMACGTGAVATVAAAIDRGLAESPVTVGVPGGELTIEIGEDGRAFMTGPVAHVFDTTVE